MIRFLLSKVVYLAGFVLLATCVVSTQVAAEPAIQITKIADNSTAVPGGVSEAFAGFSLPALDNGTVAFVGNGPTRSGIYSSQGNLLIAVVDSDDEIPEDPFGQTFVRFGQPSIDSGNVAFFGETPFSPGRGGYYKLVAGELTRVVDNQMQIPGTTDTFISFFNPPSIAGDVVVFAGGNEITGVSGIYTEQNASLTVVADTMTSIPGRQDTFTGLLDGRPQINGNTVAFRHQSPFALDEGIYQKSNVALAVVAETGDPIPDASFIFTQFTNISLSDNLISFHGLGPSNFRGIYTNLNGMLDVVVDRNTLIPGKEFTFDAGSPAADGSNIAFQWSGCPTSCSSVGLYLASGGELINVIDSGMQLDGKTILALEIGADALSGNQLAFKVSFSDFTTGIYLAAIEEDTDNDGIDNILDNCPNTSNGDQADSGGVDTTVPDGTGDACQCGDMNGDGSVTNTDSVLFRRNLLGLTSPFNPDLCDVNGDGNCSNTDSVIIRRALLGLPPGIGQVCAAAIVP